MALHEPMTLVTDYVLGFLCLALALRLQRDRSDSCRRLWAAALGACAVSAFVGGSYHGFFPHMSNGVASALWTVTLVSIGFAAFCATAATARALLAQRWSRRVEIAAGLKLAVYLYAVSRTTDFLVAIVDYSVAFGFVLGVHGWLWMRTGRKAARWIVAGVLVSFLAAGIQAIGIAPHRHFNHNDLYHVVQMAGMWMLYRGASGMQARQG